MFEIFDYLAQPSQQERDILEQQRIMEEEDKKDRNRRKKLEEKQDEFFNSLKTREDDLRNLPNTQQRLPQVTDDLWKERFGFSPVGKKGVGGVFQKLGAGLLEGANRLNKDYTSIGEEAYKRSSKNYEDDYKKLLGVERLEAQQYRDQGKLTQDLLNSNMRGQQFEKKTNLQRDIFAAQDATKNKSIEYQKQVADNKQKTQDFLAYYQAMKMKADTGNKEALTQYQELKNNFAKQLGMPPEAMNDNTIAMAFAKGIEEDSKDEFLKNIGLIKEKTQKPKTQNPRLIQNKSSYLEDGVVKEKNDFQWVYPPGSQPQGNTQGSTQNSGSTQKPQNKISGAIQAGDRLQKVDGKYFPDEISAEEAYKLMRSKKAPIVDYGKDLNAAKKDSEDLRGWKDLTQRSRIVADQAFDGLATGSMAWRNPLYKNALVDAYRAATGKTTATEATVEQNDIINLMEHIRRRFSGRPAYALFETIKKTLGGEFSDAESFATRTGGMHLLISLGQAMAENDSLVDVLDKIAKETLKDPTNRTSFGVAFSQEVASAVKKSKEKNRNVVPTIEGAIMRAFKKNKSFEEAYPQE